MTREQKKKMMQLAWKYRRQGMSPSEAMKKAHTKVAGNSASGKRAKK